SGDSNRRRKRKPRAENKSAQSFEIRERRRFEIGTKSAVRTERSSLLDQRLRLGWGARIRTWEWRNQNPLPYHLATPQGAPDHTGGSGADQSAARRRLDSGATSIGSFRAVVPRLGRKAESPES